MGPHGNSGTCNSQLPSDSLTWKWKMASWKTIFLTNRVLSTSMLVSRSVYIYNYIYYIISLYMLC